MTKYWLPLLTLVWVFLWVLLFTPTMHVQLTVDSKLPLAESNGMSVFEAGLEFTTPNTQLLAANKKNEKKMNVRSQDFNELFSDASVHSRKT